MGRFLFCVIYFLYLSLTDSLQTQLRYYETLTSSDLGHKIVKRGVQESNHPLNKIKEVSFKALGRDFRLMLSPRRGILDSQFKAYKIDSSGKEIPVFVDHECFMEGRVFGEMESEVSAHLEDGVLTASIRTPEDTFVVEPSWRHVPHSDNSSMIVYRGSDVLYSWERDPFNGVLPPKVCGYLKLKQDSNSSEKHHDDGIHFHHHEEDDVHYRAKRSESLGNPPIKTRCPLLLVADYRFYREMGASSTKTTVNYLISLIDRVHKIYTDTIWRELPGQEGFSGMGFVIKKIIVHSDATPVKPGELHYNMARQTWDVRSLLEVFSREYGHKDFCLAHLFTDIKFDGGILGLAYVGSPRRNSVGGICTPEYFKNGYTLYLNSGLSSSRNHYGQRVITREADLVTAHEFGHNWGSEHDPDSSDCSPPASQGGSYLMYTYSVSGYDINNKKFSPCSLRSIRAVLLAKSSRCFTEPEESFCGNLRVEKGEECDAGLGEEEDDCCDKNCRFRAGAVCSDKNSPCCENCHYMPETKKCREAQYATCEMESYCTGKSDKCPKSPAQPDGTECLERGKCHRGKCLPFCETQGLQSCMCDVLENACKRCCRMNLNDTCFPVDHHDTLPDGTPCIQGFCNKGTCEKTVQDVVERFWDIIEDININTVLRFLKDNIVGTVIIISIILWVPASCIISFVDRRRLQERKHMYEWHGQEELVHPQDIQLRVIYRRNPRRAGSANSSTSAGAASLQHFALTKL